MKCDPCDAFSAFGDQRGKAQEREPPSLSWNGGQRCMRVHLMATVKQQMPPFYHVSSYQSTVVSWKLKQSALVYASSLISCDFMSQQQQTTTCFQTHPIASCLQVFAYLFFLTGIPFRKIVFLKFLRSLPNQEFNENN